MEVLHDDHCLQEILSHIHCGSTLARSAQVCKKWKTVLGQQNEYFWSDKVRQCLGETISLAPGVSDGPGELDHAAHAVSDQAPPYPKLFLISSGPLLGSLVNCSTGLPSWCSLQQEALHTPAPCSRSTHQDLCVLKALHGCLKGAGLLGGLPCQKSLRPLLLVNGEWHLAPHSGPSDPAAHLEALLVEVKGLHACHLSSTTASYHSKTDFETMLNMLAHQLAGNGQHNTIRKGFLKNRMEAGRQTPNTGTRVHIEESSSDQDCTSLLGRHLEVRDAVLESGSLLLRHVRLPIVEICIPRGPTGKPITLYVGRSSISLNLLGFAALVTGKSRGQGE